MQSEPKPEPSIFNKNVLVHKWVDEECIRIYHDIAYLRRRLPMNERIFLETLKRIVRYHTKHADLIGMLRTGGFFAGDYAVDGIYKVYVLPVEITLYNVEKIWNGFCWDITNFKGLKVEKIHIIRDYRGE
jgi:hypothetical protein